MAQGGVSGAAVATAAAGGLLVYAGIVDAPLIDAVREIVGGRTPTGRAPKPTPVSWIGHEATGTLTDGTRTAIVAAARRYVGRPYRWGATGPNAFDCSGLVWRCLSDAGIQHRRLVSNAYRVWTGAKDIPRPQCSPGDLVCYTGHIGIAVSGTRMISAPSVGRNVRESNIYNGQGGPIIRRVVVK